MKRMHEAEVDIDSVKQRLAEIGMSRHKLAQKMGYGSERSVFRMLATGKMSKWAELKMKEVLYPGKCPYCGADMRGGNHETT